MYFDPCCTLPNVPSRLYGISRSVPLYRTIPFVAMCFICAMPFCDVPYHLHGRCSRRTPRCSSSRSSSSRDLGMYKGVYCPAAALYRSATLRSDEQWHGVPCCTILPGICYRNTTWYSKFRSMSFHSMLCRSLLYCNIPFTIER